MTAVTLLNTIGYILLGVSWIIDFTTDRENEKILSTKLIITSIGIGIFLSAMVVNLHQYLTK
jgi:hypothetical protein